MKWLKHLLFSFFIILPLFINGQVNIFFQHLGIHEGLPKHKIIAIEQDKNGFIWIGTHEGLFRFDGYSFQQPHPVPNRNISSLALDNDSLLWVGTGNGLYCLNLQDYSHTLYKREEELKNTICDNNIRTLFLDSHNKLWIGTKKGLSILNPHRTAFNNYYLSASDSTSLSNNIVRSVTEDVAGNIWIGTYDGLNLYNPIQRNFQRIKLIPTTKGKPQNDLILALKTFTFMPEYIIAGTNRGLLRVNINNKQCIPYYDRTDISKSPSNNIIKTIGDFYNGYIPIGTDFGFNLFSPFDGTYKHYLYDPNNTRSISNNEVWCTFIDDAGILWLGTNNGINIIDDKRNKFNVNHPYGNQIELSGYSISCFEESENHLWMGTNNGIVSLNKRNNKVTEYSTGLESNAKINHLFIDSENTLWGATSEGLYKLKEGATNFETLVYKKSKPGLSTGYPHGIAETKDKSIWIGIAGGGINRIIRSQNEIGEWVEDSIIYYSNKSKQNYIPFSDVKSILVQNDSILWISSFGSGLLKYNYINNTFKLFNEKSTGGSIIKTELLADRLLVCTSNGMVYIKNDSVKHISLPEGVNPNLMNCHIVDSNSIWLSDLTTLYKFNNLKFNNYYSSYNLNQSHSIGIFNNSASFLNSEGTLLFGALNGVISVMPDQIIPNKYKAQVQISSIFINNKLLLPGKEVFGEVRINKAIHKQQSIPLKESDKYIVIEFGAMHFSGLHANSYAYMLEGFDNEWKYTSGNKNYASYSNLRKGKYRFRLKATNNDNVWLSEEKVLELHVAPPWYASIQAIIAYILLLFLFAYMGLRIIISSREKDQIELLNQSKLRFFTNISHELKTPLTLILLPIENLLKNKITDKEQIKDSLHIVHQHASKLKKLTDQLLYFRRIEVGRQQLIVSENNLVAFCKNIFDSFQIGFLEKQINAEFISTKENIKLYFDRVKMEMVINNLLSNAVKFSPQKGSVQFSIEELKNKVAISIKDTGPGVSKENQNRIFERFYQLNNHTKSETGSGIGLSLVKDIVDNHDGNVNVESRIGKGSTFIVSLQKGKKHFSDTDEFVEQSEEILSKEEIKFSDNLNSLPELSDTEVEEDNKETILLVEDNGEIRQYIIKLLKHKYYFIEAADGLEGLNLLSEHDVTLIISDLMMPRIDGNEFCKKVKTDINFSHIPVIMLTAKSSNENRIDSLAYGADYFMTKPFDFKHLEVIISNLLETRRKLKEKYSQELVIGPDKIELKSIDEEFLKRTKQVIEDNISNFEFSVELLADKVEINHKQFYRKTKTLIGKSPVELIKDMRLDRSLQYIEISGLTIAEIAYSCGFSTPAYFTKCFKDRYKITPSKYKKETITT
jgi:signal transduction histidine kinase/ligand-binding sensor domain-containing protein/DNA-binding response OmpR family regulator